MTWHDGIAKGQEHDSEVNQNIFLLRRTLGILSETNKNKQALIHLFLMECPVFESPIYRTSFNPHASNPEDSTSQTDVFLSPLKLPPPPPPRSPEGPPLVICRCCKTPILSSSSCRRANSRWSQSGMRDVGFQACF